MYLIYPTILDAKARNHEAYLAKTQNPPHSIRDTLYLWSMVTHPKTGELALEIPNPSVDSVDEEGNVIKGNVTKAEFDALVETLDASWTSESDV